MSAFDSDEGEEEDLPPLRREDAEGIAPITDYMRRTRISTEKRVKDFERTMRREKREVAKRKKKRVKKPRFEYLHADVDEWNRTYRPTLDKKQWDDCYICKDIKAGYAMIARDRKTGAIVSVMQWDSSEFEGLSVAQIDAIGTRDDYRGKGIARYLVQDLIDNYDMVVIPMSAHDKFWRDAGFTNLTEADEDLESDIWDIVRGGPFEYSAGWHIFFIKRE